MAFSCLLALLVCIHAVSSLKTEDIQLTREACQSYSTDMCPSHQNDFSEITHSLSYIGLFMSPAGQWACEKNDYCGQGFWSRNGKCKEMDCATKVRENKAEFCSKRMTGCSKSCGCDLGGSAGKVSLMLPDNYSSSKSYTLIIWLHGYTGQASWASSMWKLDQIVDSKNVIVAAPNGGIDDLGFPYWDAGTAFHGRFADKGKDSYSSNGPTLKKNSQAYDYSSNKDEAYLLQVLTAIQSKYSIDKSKVFLAGSANGALMAYYMACSHAGLFAGVAVHGAGQDISDVEHCKPTKPLHILHIHGTQDFFKIGDAVQRLEVWSDFNGCTGVEFGTSSSKINIWQDDKLPGNETHVYDQNKCRAGGSVTLWKVQDAPHFPWFNDQFSTQLIDHLNNKVDNSHALFTATGASKITSQDSVSLQPEADSTLHLTRSHAELTMEGYNMPF